MLSFAFNSWSTINTSTAIHQSRKTLASISWLEERRAPSWSLMCQEMIANVCNFGTALKTKPGILSDFKFINTVLLSMFPLLCFRISIEWIILLFKRIIIIYFFYSIYKEHCQVWNFLVPHLQLINLPILFTGGQFATEMPKYLFFHFLISGALFLW